MTLKGQVDPVIFGVPITRPWQVVSLASWEGW